MLFKNIEQNVLINKYPRNYLKYLRSIYFTTLNCMDSRFFLNTRLGCLWIRGWNFGSNTRLASVWLVRPRESRVWVEAASELTALAAAMARSARLPMLQCRRALPTAIAVAKVDHSDTAGPGVSRVLTLWSNRSMTSAALFVSQSLLTLVGWRPRPAGQSSSIYNNQRQSYLNTLKFDYRLMNFDRLRPSKANKTTDTEW